MCEYKLEKDIGEEHMKKQVNYDFTNFTNSQSSLSKYLDLTEREIMMYIALNRDECDPVEFLNHFNIDDEKLMDTELMISSLHVTTNNDECCSIKRYGLTNLQQSVLLDTPLKRYLEDRGISINISNKEIVFKGEIYNITKEYKGLERRSSSEWVSYKLYEDYQINSFFSCANALEYGGNVSSRPEFLMNLANFLKLGSIEKDWERDTDNKCYVVKFHVPLSDIAPRTFLGLNDIGYLEKYEIEVLKRKWIIKNSLSAINNELFNGYKPEIFCEMNLDVSVPPDNIIKIYNPNEYLNEYVADI